MKKDCCIVIITHKEKLGGDEEMSFKQALKIGNDIPVDTKRSLE